MPGGDHTALVDPLAALEPDRKDGRKVDATDELLGASSHLRCSHSRLPTCMNESRHSCLSACCRSLMPTRTIPDGLVVRSELTKLVHLGHFSDVTVLGGPPTANV